MCNPYKRRRQKNNLGGDSKKIENLTMLISEMVSILAISKLMPTVTGPSRSREDIFIKIYCYSKVVKTTFTNIFVNIYLKTH